MEDPQERVNVCVSRGYKCRVWAGHRQKLEEWSWERLSGMEVLLVPGNSDDWKDASLVPNAAECRLYAEGQNSAILGSTSILRK